MGLIGCLVVTKLLECWWLIFINLRQLGKVNRVRSVPPALASVFTDVHITNSRLLANRRIVSDIVTALLETVLYCIVFSEFDVAEAWMWCQLTSSGDELLAHVIYAGCAVALCWICALPASFIKNFIINKTPLDCIETLDWVAEETHRLLSLVGEYIPAAVAVYSAPQFCNQPALVLATFSVLSHAAFYFYQRCSTEPQESVYWSMPNSKLKLRLAVIASLLGFSPQHVFTIDNWCEGDEWRPRVDGEPGPKGLASSLIVKFYREEAGGGHAKSFDVPEIMAYAAHGLSFCKNMFPLTMATFAALKTVVKILLSFKLLEHQHLYHSFGFHDVDVPPVVGLSIAYFVILSPLEKVWRYMELWGSRAFYRSGDCLVAGLGLGRQLSRALAKAEAEAGVTPAADALYCHYYATRPPLLSRINRLGTVDIGQ